MSGIGTFLKKLGSIIVDAAGIATGIGPIIQPFLGSGKATEVASTGINDLTAIGQLVAQVEAVGQSAGLTGTQKLAALLPLVSNIVKTSELVSGKKIANETLFTTAVQELGQGMVDLLNSLDEGAAKTA